MKSYNEIIQKYSEKVFNHCLKLVKNVEDAEELTQDIFLKIYKGLSDFRGESTINTWIYRITVNTCLTKINSKYYRNKTEKIEESIPDTTNNPEDLFIKKERHYILDIAINLLSIEEQQLLIMFYIDGLSYKNIGEILELPIGTICTKIYRVRKKLKKILLREFNNEM